MKTVTIFWWQLKGIKDNTFLEPYASLISVCVQGLAELIWPQSMCVQVLAKLICESVGIQIVRNK